MKMKTGTVKWFNLQKGHGFVYPDDGGPNIFVDNFAVECAGMHCLTEGQRIIFEIRSDKRTGSTTARSLAPLEFGSFRRDGQPSNRRASAARPPLDGHFATTNPFDTISDMISSALWTRLQP